MKIKRNLSSNYRHEIMILIKISEINKFYKEPKSE